MVNGSNSPMNNMNGGERLTSLCFLMIPALASTILGGWNSLMVDCLTLWDGPLRGPIVYAAVTTFPAGQICALLFLYCALDWADTLLADASQVGSSTSWLLRYGGPEHQTMVTEMMTVTVVSYCLAATFLAVAAMALKVTLAPRMGDRLAWGVILAMSILIRVGPVKSFASAWSAKKTLRTVLRTVHGPILVLVLARYGILTATLLYALTVVFRGIPAWASSNSRLQPVFGATAGLLIVLVGTRTPFKVTAYSVLILSALMTWALALAKAQPPSMAIRSIASGGKGISILVALGAGLLLSSYADRLVPNSYDAALVKGLLLSLMFKTSDGASAAWLWWTSVPRWIALSVLLKQTPVSNWAPFLAAEAALTLPTLGGQYRRRS